MSHPLTETLQADRDSDIRTWSSLIDQSAFPDSYYRPGYVLANREENTRSTVALVIHTGHFRYLMPLLIAEVEGQGSSRSRYAYSPYGYGGILPLDTLQHPDREEVLALQHAIQVWAEENKLICIVARLHPLFRQDAWFDANERDAILRTGNHTIALDLNDWNEDAQCIGSLKKGRRSDLNYARRKLRVTWNFGWSETSRQSIALFQTIYNSYMASIGADPFYVFPDAYYLDLAKGLGEHLGIALAWRGDEAVGGALFMADVRYAHYHLSSVTKAGYDCKASTFLVNEGAVWARSRGCQGLHLGGGVGDGDSLFRFKESFGGTLHRYGTLTVIADRDVFASLCQTPGTGWPFTTHVPHRPTLTIETCT